MRVGLCLLIATLAAACGSAEPVARPARYGISLDVPDGLSAEVTRGMIRIATTDLSVVLYEYEPTGGEAAFFKDDWPVRLDAADFAHQRPGTAFDEDARLVSVAGRFFSVFLGGDASPAARQLEELNEALARIEVQAGDFYPGSVQPVAFPERPGWHVVSSGESPRRAYGESVQSAAATIPFRNHANDLPPRETLEALPADGILVWVSLIRESHFPPSRLNSNEIFEPRRAPPYRLADLLRRDDWQGQVRDLPEYLLSAATGDRYLVDLRVYFGREHPTRAMFAEADAVLAGLRFPNWGSWELEAG